MCVPRHVSGSDLMVCGDYVYSHYKDCQDGTDYISPDKITDIVCMRRDKVSK